MFHRWQLESHLAKYTANDRLLQLILQITSFPYLETSIKISNGNKCSDRYTIPLPFTEYREQLPSLFEQLLPGKQQEIMDFVNKSINSPYDDVILGVADNGVYKIYVDTGLGRLICREYSLVDVEQGYKTKYYTKRRHKTAAEWLKQQGSWGSKMLLEQYDNWNFSLEKADNTPDNTTAYHIQLKNPVSLATLISNTDGNTVNGNTDGNTGNDWVYVVAVSLDGCTFYTRPTLPILSIGNVIKGALIMGGIL
jgi:hypothetical protein